jgi:ribosomal protein S18 acetylase RimI-like enzyme
MRIKIQTAQDADRAWIAAHLLERWGSVRLVSRGVLHRADRLPALIAWRGERRVGLLTYRLLMNTCEIVSLDSLEQGQGVATTLLEALRVSAVLAGCQRIWLVTTNDNKPAQRFYERQGFGLVAVHRGAVEAARRLKPEIPLRGLGGIPIEDELEYELRLDA